MGNIFNQSPPSRSSLSKAKRDLSLGLKRSPLFSWRYKNQNVQQLLLVPRDLRTADPSLSIELDMGQFGLAGATVFLNGGSPFQAEPPNISWLRELHGFSWVRNLRAARTDRSQEQAMELTNEWLTQYRSQKDTAWEPEVAARRLISWLSHSNFLLYEADEKAYIHMMSSIEDHMRFLSMTGAQAAPGMPRLLSLIALMFAGLCVKEQEKFAEQHARLMCAELDKQIQPDGGHISRDNSVLASILLDLLPLKQCFVTRNMKPPQPLLDAINRMLPMIHFMRLGDGLMSRFNGAGTTLPDTLSTAMAYDDVSNAPLKEAPYSRYFRMQKGNVVVLMDGGGPASLDLTAKSHAGCLSFEMSSGTCPMIVNCGAAPPAYQTMSSNARATVSHSTLTVNNRSSAQFHHDKQVKNSEIPSLLSGPPSIKAWYETEAEKVKIIGSHDGYLDNFGLIHHRLLSLSNDGYTFIGEDWIETSGAMEVSKGTDQADSHLSGYGSGQRLGWPYAVHFHIHPDVETTRSGDGKSITLTLPDSQEWKLSAQGAIFSLEESIFYADFAGPCQSVQAVLRGNCVGNTSVSWMLAKVVQTHTDKKPKVPEWMAENVIPLEQAAASSSLKQEEKDKEKEDAIAPDVPPPPPAKPSDKPAAKVTELVEDFDEEGEEDANSAAKQRQVQSVGKQDVLALEGPKKSDEEVGKDADGESAGGNAGESAERVRPPMPPEAPRKVRPPLPPLPPQTEGRKADQKQEGTEKSGTLDELKSSATKSDAMKSDATKSERPRHRTLEEALALAKEKAELELAQAKETEAALAKKQESENGQTKDRLTNDRQTRNKEAHNNQNKAIDAKEGDSDKSAASGKAATNKRNADKPAKKRRKKPGPWTKRDDD